jgi:hypothetical protein
MRELERAMLSSAFVRRYCWLIPSMCFDFEGYLVWVFGMWLGRTLASLPIHSISCLAVKLPLFTGTGSHRFRRGGNAGKGRGHPLHRRRLTTP